MRDVLVPYASPVEHAAASEILRRVSSNPRDVRAVALEGVDLGRCHRVVDLGCGYGFMAEVVAERCPDDAVILGVDACSANGPHFLDAVARSGRRGRFEARSIDRSLPWPDEAFDLVVASYALYYFVGALQEIARILDHDGMFLVLTHRRNDLARIIEIGELPPEGTPHQAITRCFAAEEGAERLAPYFEEIHRIDFGNRLVFGRRDLPDLLRLAAFKLPQLLPPDRPLEAAREQLGRKLSDVLASRGRLVVEKDDAIFRCRGPRCH